MNFLGKHNQKTFFFPTETLKKRIKTYERKKSVRIFYNSKIKTSPFWIWRDNQDFCECIEDWRAKNLICKIVFPDLMNQVEIYKYVFLANGIKISVRNRENQYYY